MDLQPEGRADRRHPSHAFNTFSLSGMDLLFLNNYVVSDKAKKKIADTKFVLRHEGDTVTELVS